MDPFSYLSVLISIVLALGMTRVLAGVGDMLQARSHRRIYWVHAVWIVNLFFYLVVAWWIFYRWRNQQTWTFFLFVFVLISPTILYLASLLLFPREGDVDLAVDYKTHYYANQSAFVPLWIVAKKILQLGMRRSIRENIKASIFGELLCGEHKPTPRRTRERTAHTHSPDAERSGI
jgi:hypothetical protein